MSPHLTDIPVSALCWPQSQLRPASAKTSSVQVTTFSVLQPSGYRVRVWPISLGAQQRWTLPPRRAPQGRVCSRAAAHPTRPGTLHLSYTPRRDGGIAPPSRVPAGPLRPRRLLAALAAVLQRPLADPLLRARLFSGRGRARPSSAGSSLHRCPAQSSQRT